MELQIQQAYADFEKFLEGSRAPALVAHSLKAVVAHDVRVTARRVVDWAYRRPNGNRFDALMTARSKVFDIFFYRVVPFQRIHGFFDGFEEAVLAAIPPPDRSDIEARFRSTPWEGLRPWPVAREMQEIALERRKAVSVDVEAFNEDLYKNTTHQILSADKRYTFSDDEARGRISEYQEKVAEVFDDFVSLIQDPERKREILLANAADKGAAYESKQRFSIDSYVCQLADFAVALFNDDYPEHGVQVFGVISSLGAEHSHDFAGNAQFQGKAVLFNRQKLGEYAAGKTGALLLRGVLPLFVRWYPESLLGEILREEDRRERKVALALLDAYGPDGFGVVVESLEACNETTPWYYVRNLAYLLGRMTTPDEDLRQRAVRGLDRFLSFDQPKQVAREVVSALAAIGGELASQALASKLESFAPEADRRREAHELCHRIAPSLIALETERGVEAAFEFCFRHGFVEQYRDAFARVALPPNARARIVKRVRKEARKLKMSFSFLGDPNAARSLLSALGHAGYPDVAELCREITSTFPATSPLGMEAARLLQAQPPPPHYSHDRALNRLLGSRELAPAMCQMYDTGATGRLEATTRDGVSCAVEVMNGAVVHASVPTYAIEGDDAFLWVVLLDAKDIASVSFRDGSARRDPPTVTRPTWELLRDAIFQRSEVQQISDHVIAPDARFRRRDVPVFQLQFEQIDEPRKYEAVWDAIAEETDVRGVRAATRLSRHDIYRILFYLVRRDALAIAGEEHAEGAAGVDEAIVSLARAIHRIAARPVHFQAYAAGAESAAFVERNADNPTIASAAAAIRAFLLDAHAHRRALTREGLELCREAVVLVEQCRRSRDQADYRQLADLVAFSFATVPPPVVESSPADPATRELERIENIDLFDDADTLFNADAVDELFDSLDAVLKTGRVTGQLKSGPLDTGLTASEEAMLLELFGNIANAYVKPFKDFVRELDRNHKAKAPTSSDWLEFVEPSVRLMAGAAQKMGYAKIHTVMAHVEELMAKQRAKGDEVLPRLFCEQILVEHHKLSKVLPTTFALALTSEELASKKEGLIVKFILKQIPEVTDRVMNKVLFAGLNSFDRFSDTPPEEIAHVTGIERALADRIFMKFYQYQDVYYHYALPEKRRKFVQMFDISLEILREIHIEVERLVREQAAGGTIAEARKQALEEDRLRTLFSVYVLLCIRGDHDLVERLQLSVFEDRVRLLGDYYLKLAAEDAVGTAA